ncbi:hypothetical protein [Streptomyces sp. NBC_01483]|uniref:hypothetical protein n=1 Tax=Streptomyces sp. NBC_01483 TaxID=2903883 RepID=UPI002E318186|nr:hypothetical protein [Streptomyces sp. NBC_01483]
MAHATISDLEAWLAPETAPANAWRLLEQASDRIDEALIGAMYDPTDTAVQDVLRKATVRQVHWMLERGDETGAQDDVQSMTTGQRSITRRTNAGHASAPAPRISPQAVTVLRNAGLLTMWPLVVG